MLKHWCFLKRFPGVFMAEGFFIEALYDFSLAIRLERIRLEKEQEKLEAEKIYLTKKGHENNEIF